MKKEFLTDDQVEEEIARLQKLDEVKLGQKERRIKYKRRQYMYTLRVLEKRGKELMEAGINLENIEEVLFPSDCEEREE